MEGIMNLPADVGGATSQDGLDSFAPLIAAQQAARDMGYPRFTRELLSAGSEMDQAEVQEFLQTIRDAGLTSEDVALMRRVVEAVFGDPNNYPEVRARLLAEGVPEDILPETFDLEFFVALRMAVEEAENLSQEPRPTGQDMPVQMAEGGIVGLPQMTPIAREMAAMGRNGDTMLAHITPQEAMMLQRMGGSGTINPYTGLPEFFFKKLFRGIGKAIKSVGKAVKKFAKSTVGRIVLSVALGAFLGPMATGFLTGAGVTVGAAAAAGITAGVGVFGSSLLAGDGFKNSLRNGLTAGALSFGVAGVSQAGGFSAPATGLPENLTKGYQQGIANIKAPFQAAADFIRGGPEAAANVPAPGVGPVGDATTVAQRLPGAGEGIPIRPDGVTSRVLDPQGFGTTDIPMSETSRVVSGPSGFSVDAPTLSSPASVTNAATFTPPSQDVLDFKPDYSIPTGAAAPVTSTTGLTPGARTSIPGGAERGFFDKTIDFFSPSAREAAGKQAAEQAFQETLARAKSAGATESTAAALAEKAYQAALPGTVSKYLPLIAGIGTVGVGTGMIGSPFAVPEGAPAKTTKEMIAESEKIGQDYLRANPQFAGTFVPSYYPPPTYRAAEGSGPKGVENFPRKTGAINGPGTGTSDDIPAMLSDGEFVFTAKSVRNMGGGSRRKGAAKMYKLMKMLEGGPVSKTAGA
jgi:hypothetical protein